MIFVNSGIDTDKQLTEQGDSFWWKSRKFDKITRPYSPFQKIIRGYDPNHKGTDFNGVKATIDGGCGFGGTLICAVFNQNGGVLGTLECKPKNQRILIQSQFYKDVLQPPFARYASHSKHGNAVP